MESDHSGPNPESETNGHQGNVMPDEHNGLSSPSSSHKRANEMEDTLSVGSSGPEGRARRRKSTIKARIANGSNEDPTLNEDHPHGPSLYKGKARRQTVTERNHKQSSPNGQESGSAGEYEDEVDFQRASSSSFKMSSPMSLQPTLSSGSSPSATYSLSSSSQPNRLTNHEHSGSARRRSKRAFPGEYPFFGLRSSTSPYSLTSSDHPASSGHRRYYGSGLQALGLSNHDSGGSIGKRNARDISAGLSLQDLAARTRAGTRDSPGSLNGMSSSSIHDILNEIDVRDALRMIQGSGNGEQRRGSQQDKSGRDFSEPGKQQTDVRIRKAEADVSGPIVPDPDKFDQRGGIPDEAPSKTLQNTGNVAKDVVDGNDRATDSKNKSLFKKKRGFFGFRRKKEGPEDAHDKNAAEMASSDPGPIEARLQSKKTDHEGSQEQPGSPSPRSPEEEFEFEVEEARATLSSSTGTTTRAQKVRTTLEDRYGYIYALLAGSQFSSPGAPPNAFHDNPYNPLKTARARQDHLDQEAAMRRNTIGRRALGRRSVQHTAMNSVESFGELQSLNTGNHLGPLPANNLKNIDGDRAGNNKLTSTSSVTDPQKLPFYLSSPKKVERGKQSHGKSHNKGRSSKNRSLATLGDASIFGDHTEASSSPWVVSTDDMRAADDLRDRMYQTDSNQTETSFSESIDQDSIIDYHTDNVKNSSIDSLAGKDDKAGSFLDKGSPSSNRLRAKTSSTDAVHESGVQVRDMLGISHAPETDPSPQLHRSNSSISAFSSHSTISRTSFTESGADSSPNVNANGNHTGRLGIRSIPWLSHARSKRAHRHSKSAPLPSEGQDVGTQHGDAQQNGVSHNESQNDIQRLTTATSGPNGPNGRARDGHEAKQADRGAGGLSPGGVEASSGHPSGDEKNEEVMLSPVGDASYQEFTTAACADGKSPRSGEDGDLSIFDERAPLDKNSGEMIEGDFPNAKGKRAKSGPPMKAVELIYVQKRALELDEMLNILHVFTPHIQHIHGVLGTQLGTCRDFMDRIEEMELDISLSKEETNLLKEADDWSEEIKDPDGSQYDRNASPLAMSKASSLHLTTSTPSTRPQTAKSGRNNEEEKAISRSESLAELQFLNDGGDSSQGGKPRSDLQARRLAKASYQGKTLRVPTSIPIQRSSSSPGQQTTSLSKSTDSSRCGSPRKGSLSPLLVPPTFDRRLLSESMPLNEPNHNAQQGGLAISNLDALNLDPGRKRLDKIQREMQMQEDEISMRPRFANTVSSFDRENTSKDEVECNDPSNRLAQAYRNTRQVTMPFSKMSSFELGRSNIDASVRDMGRAQEYMEKRLQDLIKMQESSGESIKGLANEIDSIQSGINEGTYQNLKSLEDYFVKMQRSGSRSNASAALSLINSGGSGPGSGSNAGNSTMMNGVSGWFIDLGFGLLSWIVVAILWLIWFVVGVGKIVTWPVRMVFKLLHFTVLIAIMV